jgi:hypothetical protein
VIIIAPTITNNKIKLDKNNQILYEVYNILPMAEILLVSVILPSQLLLVTNITFRIPKPSLLIKSKASVLVSWKEYTILFNLLLLLFITVT